MEDLTKYPPQIQKFITDKVILINFYIKLGNKRRGNTRIQFGRTI